MVERDIWDIFYMCGLFYIIGIFGFELLFSRVEIKNKVVIPLSCFPWL